MDEQARLALTVARLAAEIATLRTGLRAIESTDDGGQSVAKYMRYEARLTLNLADAESNHD
jgi:hypothetical protein